jgi:hypothetical protein
VIQDDNERDKIAFARFINEHSLQLIGHIDLKSSIIVAINGVILGLLFGSKDPLMPPSGIHHFLLLFVTILLGVSAVFGLLTIFPRICAELNSIIFHETILYKVPFQRLRSLRSKQKIQFEDYEKVWDCLNVQRILYEEILNAYRLAGALNYQFFWVRLSIAFLISAIVPLVVLLLTVGNK